MVPLARLGQARCLRNSHQPDAMASLFRAIAADTGQATVAATALWEWAREYKALGRFSGADSALTLYIDRFPYGSDIYPVLLTRGVCRLMLSRPGPAQADADMAAAALADPRPERNVDPSLRAAARQQLAGLRQALPFQPPAAHGAVAALVGDEHRRPFLARRRAFGLGHRDEHGRRACREQPGELGAQAFAHATCSIGPASARSRSTASSRRSGVAGASRHGQMR